ncbi:MAG TPA: CAP domain-containing protein, partial [Pyrinomonadaceae bacterium]|nr:CAP domain-containing protein [Pyrinomonadaceae bacterium]
SMSEPERDLLNEINQARANPQLYASYLEKLKPLFNGKQYKMSNGAALVTEEGWTAVDDAIKFLRSAKPLGPLNPSQGLSLAAMSHVKEQSGSGNTGHQGANRMMIEDRVKPFGNWQGNIGENITYGNDSARERLLTWLIDDGFPSRGHRNRVMSGDYKVAGISCGSHPQYSAMCVLTLAGGFMDVPTTVTPAPTTKTSPAKPANSKAPSTKATKM